MKVRVCFHDKCFDGAASAAVFTRFYRQRLHPEAEFAYSGLSHRATQLFDDGIFDGDENVIVDFKYSSAPQLTWWFDHHQSAFLSPEDAEHFRHDRSGKKFYDPSYKSCTKFLATVARERFQFDASSLDQLIAWADIIDGAQYPTPESAVRMAEPAMRLALVMEGVCDKDFVPRLVPELATRSLEEVVELPQVAKHVGSLYARHEASIEIIEGHSEYRDGVIYFDLSSFDMEGYNKFIPYYLHRDCLYSVGVSHSPLRAKVAVGSNPWHADPKERNLATICERYGGGGHPRVAAISFEPTQLDHARKVAREIAEDLRK
ncbi:MAG TPA: hypothetical protein VIH17_09250 [Candidatus Acidoferrales bacterium]